MHFIVALFVIIGLIGGVMLFLDEDHNLFGLSESSNIVKKFKQEEEAFAEFCKGQQERDEAKKVDPVQAVAGEVQSNNAAVPAQNTTNTAHNPAPPASFDHPFGNTASGVSFNQNAFGNDDFHHLGDVHTSTPAAQAPAGPVTQPPASDGNMSQAQKMKSSSNPIIKTWAGYVSQIEDAEK